MAKKQNERQHFVPESYLKRFTSDDTSDGTLGVIDTLRNNYFVAIPRQVANRKEFYRLKDGLYEVEPDTVDTFLDSNLNFLNEIAESIISHKKIPSPKEKYNDLHMQMALLMARNPQSLNSIRLMYETAMIEHLKPLMETAPPEIQRLAAENALGVGVVPEIKEDYFLVQIPLAAEQYRKALLKRNWCVVEAPDDCLFVTSDLPVSVKKIEPINGNWDGGLTDPDTRVFFPISKKIGVLGEFGELEAYYKLNKLQAAVFNLQTIEQPLSQFYFCPDDFTWRNGKNFGNKEDYLKWRNQPYIIERFSKFPEDSKKAKVFKILKELREKFDMTTFKKKP